MQITLLGTGTSQGVPVIGCTCAVCTSDDPRDQRLRSAALINHNGFHVLIDTGPDFRQQMLRAKVSHLDAILLTHEHNDHAIGLDDIRPFNFSSGHPMRVYAQERVANDVRRRFEYVFGEPIPGLPRVELIHIDEHDTLNFPEAALTIQPIGVMHGRLPILGFRCGDFAYLTDVKTIEPPEMDKLYGVKYLVVNALQHLFHPTHMSLEESLAFIKLLQPERTWLTHASHHLGKTADILPTLPPGVEMGYDGLVISV